MYKLKLVVSVDFSGSTLSISHFTGVKWVGERKDFLSIATENSEEASPKQIPPVSPLLHF